jgi:tetratricopeptide (TPR) repeat protein
MIRDELLNLEDLFFAGGLGVLPYGQTGQKSERQGQKGFRAEPSHSQGFDGGLHGENNGIDGQFFIIIGKQIGNLKRFARVWVLIAGVGNRFVARRASLETSGMRTAIIIAFAVLGYALPRCTGQTPPPSHDEPGLEGAAASAPESPFEGPQRAEFESALRSKDYKAAESLLVKEAESDPKSIRAAKLFAIAGGIFFLDAQYLNSVIAWKKSEAIAPLDERSRFTMAMAEIRLNHRDWAKAELDKLAASRPQNPLYVYWLGRLDYDGRQYADAIGYFERAIQLDPEMMRAYYNLGLCLDYVGRVDEAIGDYQRAIVLNRQQPHPSPWPHLDLAIALIEKNQLAEAEKTLREAIGYDARLPQAYYQLGRVLDSTNREQESVAALKQATALDAAYPDPHYLLGRIYRRMGEKHLAQTEADLFLKLKRSSSDPLNSQPGSTRP